MLYAAVVHVPAGLIKAIARLSLGLGCSIAIVCLYCVSCLAAVPAVPGAACWSSETKLQDNLPLGTTARSTEVTNIFGISNGSLILGWYYETRRGEYFVQARSGQANELASLMHVAGAPFLGNGILGNRPHSYIAVDANTAKPLTQYLYTTNSLVPCFSGLLP